MEQGTRQRRPRYIREDRSPTTEQELRGWYSYAIAAEVFAVSGTGSFLPLVLEQLARENGVLKSDGVTSCVQPASAMRYLGKRAEQDNACVVHILGTDINTASFALYTSALAVGMQALVLISISAIADHGEHALSHSEYGHES
jgi:UMF1 family MFS transporter